MNRSNIKQITETQLKEIISESIVNTINSITDNLMESSLSRVNFWVENYDIATITAFRNRLCCVTDATLIDKNLDPDTNESIPYTKSENLQRNKRLKSTLLRLGYGVTKIHGNYIENLGGNHPIEVGENSFLVVNINKSPDFYNKIFSLSEYYNQDSFLYKAAGTVDAYLVGTNLNNNAIGYNITVNVGNITYGLESMFMSKIGNNPFAFLNKSNTSYVNKKEEITPDMANDGRTYVWSNNGESMFLKNKQGRIAAQQRIQDWKKEHKKEIKKTRQNKKLIKKTFTNESVADNILLETINDYGRNAQWGINVIGNEILNEIENLKLK